MESPYFTDGHSVRDSNGIYCVAHDVPAATEICNILNHHYELLEALEETKTTLELYVAGCRTTEEAELRLEKINIVLAKTS